MISAEYDHTNPTFPVKYNIDLDNESIIDPNGIYYMGFRLQKQTATDSSGTQHIFYKLLKSYEGYQYYVTPNLLWTNIIIDDMQVTWNLYTEYQPKINSQSVNVGDTLANNATMQNCYWKN